MKVSLPKRFDAYIITQSLGAFNDNFYKMLLQLYVIQILVSQNAEEILYQATLVFTVPFVLFGPWSGYFADKYSKSFIMKVVKFAEIGVMALGATAFYLRDLNMMLAILFLMATQSTFFSPAKYGYIPEACRPEAVTKANSWVEMSTFVAIILGTAFTGLLLTLHDDNPLTITYYCIGVAVIGSLTSLLIDRAPPAGSTEKFPWSPLSGIWNDVIFLKRQKSLFLAALANSYFWLLGLIFQTNILIYAKNIIGMSSSGNILLSLLPAFIGIGIAAGSMLASRWSGHKVELGLVPLGGLGMAFCAIILYLSDTSYPMTSVILFIAGVCGGLYIVPLYAFLQFYADEHEKGRVLASANIINGFFMVLGTNLYGLLAVNLSLSSPAIFLVMGITTILVVIYICTVIPEYFIRFCSWLLTHTFYRIKIVGDKNVPFKGAALLTPNHVTFVDAFLIGSTLQRFIRFIMLKSYYDIPLINSLFKIMRVIPIDPGAGKEAVADSLQRAKLQLKENHVVCIFPEGKLTRDGRMNEFRRGFESILEGLDCPIIPVYLENAWGSIFSYKHGKALWKWPSQIPRPITIHYGEPLPPDSTAAEVEAAVRAMADSQEVNGSKENADCSST